jgi:hypothetical protein
MSPGLFALLRFLRHEFERELEHVDLRLEGIDELDLEGRELALEVGHALLEALEFNRGYILEAFAALGELRPECKRLPTPGGERTVAVLTLSPSAHACQALGLTSGQRVGFDGVFAYLLDPHDNFRLWAEIGDQPILADGSAARGKLPLVR